MNPETTYYPSAVSPLPDPISGLGTLSQVLIFLVLIAAGCMLIVRYVHKRKDFFKKSPKATQPLRVHSSHSLGNRQYLVIVEFADKELLLGVSPGHIQTLCSAPSIPQESFQDTLNKQAASKAPLTS